MSPAPFTFDESDVTFDSSYYGFAKPWGEPVRCPPKAKPRVPCDASLEQHHANVINLMPRGFAWDAVSRQGTVMYGFWRAVARTMKWFTDEVCVLADEFFCSTRRVLAPDYDIEYGLPDPCVPYLSPCSFRPVESATCADLAELLALQGWDIECTVESVNWSSGCAATGCAVSANISSPKLFVIIVHTDTSPVFDPTASSSSGLAATGCAVSGCEATSPGTIPSLRCVIDNFLPAHIFYSIDVQP